MKNRIKRTALIFALILLRLFGAKPNWQTGEEKSKPKPPSTPKKTFAKNYQGFIGIGRLAATASNGELLHIFLSSEDDSATEVEGCLRQYSPNVIAQTPRTFAFPIGRICKDGMNSGFAKPDCVDFDYLGIPENGILTVEVNQLSGEWVEFVRFLSEIIRPELIQVEDGKKLTIDLNPLSPTWMDEELLPG
jgi:hypothetical protein